MTRTEEFYKKLAAISDEELIKKAHEEVSKLCKTGGKSIRMCVPPSVYDTDMVLCEIIRRYKEKVNPNPNTSLT